MTERFQLHPTLARDGFAVGDLRLSHVLLMNDERFPWFVLVPRRSNIREVYELSRADQILLQDEIAYVGESLMKAFSGNKLNVAALGNQVPQLHVHLVVRFHHDACWPNPIWCQGWKLGKRLFVSGWRSTIRGLYRNREKLSQYLFDSVEAVGLPNVLVHSCA